jgi:multiple sugar transport system ATP-binding protein
LDAVSFDVAPGRTLAIVGPSGAGKTSLLRAIAGLARASGTIAIGARRLETLVPQDRRVALVFAKDALLEHRTIRENIRFGMRSPVEDRRIDELALALDIERHLPRRPRDLSTGERQRAAIARAVLADPEVLLLDEPLAPLDPQLRARVRDELLAVRTRFAGPMIVVTHDHLDAMTVAHELAVLIDGRLEDCGEPQRVYDAPATLKAAMFLGVRPMNALDGAALGESASVIVGIRPERMYLRDDGMLSGTVERIERTGADAYMALQTNAGRALVRIDPSEIPQAGARIRAGWRPEDVRRYDRDSGRALP